MEACNKPNNKVNVRVQLTKKSVQDAVLSMLKKYNINKISILKLCQVAGINRTTFYNYYGSQYDVLNEIAEKYLENTSNTIIKDLDSGKSLVESLSKVLLFIKDNMEFAKLVLEQDNYDIVSKITVSLPRFDNLLIERLDKNLNLNERNAISSFIQYGTVRLLKEWILNGCNKSPEEQVELMLFVIRNAIKGFA